ncbi:hypothetical protein [Kribbella sp. NPDC004536]|uniref:hypothetical protein n=1 Tax=Kribbella sp. NPDC004536 TaxID=3364106 RepID=UPI0036945871
MLNADDELQRLRQSSSDAANKASIQLSAESADSAELLSRCTEVLEVVLQRPEPAWPDLSVWQRVLPAWFVQACAPERTAEEAQADLIRWRTLSPAEQKCADEESRWSLSDWLWWLEPDNRTWYWLGADLIGRHQLLIYLETDGDPSPTGAIHWLLKAAGAARVDET